MEIVRTAFAVPNEGGTDPEAYDNRMVMCHHLGILQVCSSLGMTEFEEIKLDYPKGKKFQFWQMTIGNVFTALARERLAEMAVEMGMDYLFMIDDDMIVESDIFERLYRHNVDICAGLAFTRIPPHKPVIYEVNKGFDQVEKRRYYINHTLLSYPKNQLVECDAVGFGGVLIKTSVLKGMKKPWFMVTSGAGEDIHFCHMAKEQGFRVFMDTSVKMGHLGVRPVITEETYEAQENIKALKEKYGDKSICP